MKQRLIPRSLYSRVLIALIFSTTVVLAGITVYNVRESQARLAGNLMARAESDAAILAQASSVFFPEDDTWRLGLLAQTATTNNEEVSYIAFYDENGTLLADGTTSADQAARHPFPELLNEVQATGFSASRWTDQYLEYAKPVFTHTRVGTVALRLSAKELQASRDAALKQGIFTTIILAVVLFALLGAILRQVVIVPLRRLSSASQQISSGDWVAPPGQERQDELGQLARSFGQMVDALHQRETQLHEQVATVQNMNVALDARVAERTQALNQMVNRQEYLLQQLREVSTPVVPVLKGVLVVPIIGSLDSQRADQLIQNVLHSVAEHRARVAILDITGVPVVDTEVAQMLIRVARSTELLGTLPILVGIRPEVAQTLVQLGVGMGTLRTHGTLQEALEKMGVRWKPGHHAQPINGHAYY